ncbi:hypothetical protein [Paenibacillus wynnii]|uniref:hypothetical protein n=1 Tax=Paenibacillus wynnii TaxID=268407 RepID=UPI00278F653B|nr:hypothetical protein [Paenibacillus wynnii]MDQ0193080.1 hypothetical protein [Paenibacillus wynnii]
MKKKIIIVSAIIIVIFMVISIKNAQAIHQRITEERNHVEFTDEFKNELNTLLDKKDYSTVADKTLILQSGNEEIDAYYSFAKAMISYLEYDREEAGFYFDSIPRKYNLEFAERYMKDTMAINEQRRQIENAKYANQPPAIGETKEQLKTSSWGLPKDINKTITENNISEQWVYGDGKYVYLENGIVTTIQK